MGFFDFITNPINNAWDSVVDSNPITSGVSNALHDIGESTGINDFTDTYAPYVAAAVAAYLTGGAIAPELFAESAGGALGAEGAGSALSAEGLGGAVGSDLAGSGAVGADGFYGLGNGTSYAQGATTNPLSSFYGTAQSSPTSLGLVSGGGGSSIGDSSIIGSGTGLGQTVPASIMNAFSGASGLPNLPNLKSGSSQKQMANALRLPTDLNTNVAIYKQENPFYYSPQQQLANMLKV